MAAEDQKYVVTAMFTDNEQINIQIAKSEMNEFFQCVADGKPYVNASVNAGVWCNNKIIRYIVIKGIDEAANDVVEKDPVANDEDQDAGNVQ